MTVETFVVILVAAIVLAIFSLCRDSSRRESAQTIAAIPTAYQRRAWDRERASSNPRFRGRGKASS